MKISGWAIIENVVDLFYKEIDMKKTSMAQGIQVLLI
jgi:hypothetical protein